MRQALDYAVELNIIDFSPFSRVKINTKLFRKVPKPANETQVYSRSEVQQVEELAWDKFNNKTHKKHQLIPLAVLFSFYTGCRLGEVCCLRYEDIEGNSIHIRRLFDNYEKRVLDRTKTGASDRKIPLVSRATNIIETARQLQASEGVSTTDYIFSMTSDPCSYGDLRKEYYKYCKILDIIPKSSHKARKTFASILIDEHVNINTVREIMGHEDERTTYNCYCFDPTDSDYRASIIEDALS